MTNWLWTDLMDPKTTMGALAYALFFGLSAWAIGRAVHLALHRYLDSAQNAGADPTAIRFLGQLSRLMVYVFAFGYYAHLIPALKSLGTAWLASVGVVSVVFGLAAQTTLGNLISGISLVLYRPFKIGDRMQVTAPSGLETGVVESIDLGYTVLRTLDGRRVVIPNSTMASQTSVNLPLSGAGSPCNVTITLASTTDLDRARGILLVLAKAHPKISRIDGCPVTALGGGGATLTLTAWSPDPPAATQAKSDLLEDAKKQFDAAGLKIA